MTIVMIEFLGCDDPKNPLHQLKPGLMLRAQIATHEGRLHAEGFLYTTDGNIARVQYSITGSPFFRVTEASQIEDAN